MLHDLPNPGDGPGSRHESGEYQDFVYAAGKLDQPDPVSAWKAEGERMRELQAREVTDVGLWFEGGGELFYRIGKPLAWS